MIENDKCPKCGSREIGQGRQKGYANMFPVDDILGISNGSKIIYDICTECGYIIEGRVEKPHKFK